MGVFWFTISLCVGAPYGTGPSTKLSSGPKITIGGACPYTSTKYRSCRPSFSFRSADRRSSRWIRPTSIGSRFDVHRWLLLSWWRRILFLSRQRRGHQQQNDERNLPHPHDIVRLESHPPKSNSTLRTNSSRTGFSTQRYSAFGVSGLQRRVFPQVQDDISDFLRNVVDFGLGSPAAEPEPQ